MLRITTHDDGKRVILQLEGRLAGAWATVLRDCWERQLARPGGQRVRVDLRGVTFVDAAGKALLKEMCRQNVEFDACDCEMIATVAELACPRGGSQ
jgi:anti-anti-sigma regulatory factor